MNIRGLQWNCPFSQTLLSLFKHLQNQIFLTCLVKSNFCTVASFLSLNFFIAGAGILIWQLLIKRALIWPDWIWRVFLQLRFCVYICREKIRNNSKYLSLNLLRKTMNGATRMLLFTVTILLFMFFVWKKVLIKSCGWSGKRALTASLGGCKTCTLRRDAVRFSNPGGKAVM